MALACVVGEYIVKTGNEAQQGKRWFLGLVEAYVSAGADGARTGPDDEPSLIRKPSPR